ncbi:MAG: DUF4349 domain-containing protein [Actinomycetota bacterium]
MRWLALLVFTAMIAIACGDDDDTSADTASFDAAEDNAGDSDGDDGGAVVTDGADETTSAEPADDDFDMAEDDMADDGESFDADFGSDDSAGFDPPELPTIGDRNALTTALFVGLDIIFTGEVILESPDVKQTTRTVIDTVFANGGAIWGQDSQSDPTPRTVLTVRVPPDDFPNVMSALTALEGIDGVGIVSESVSTDDVTDVVIDLDARILAAEGALQRVQERLDAATDINRIFELEEEVANRQAELERLRGQSKTLADQIALSTITVTIIEADPDRLGADMEVVAWLGENRDDACPGVSDLQIEADGSAVLCVNISNTGEDALTDVDVTAPTFRLRKNDFSIVGDGSLDELGAGDELLVIAELDADDGFIHRVDTSGGLRIDVGVTAEPVTTPDAALDRTDAVVISADRDDPLPGFADSFSGGWRAMIVVLSLLMLILGAILPFVPIIVLAVWLGRKAMASNRRRADERRAFVEAYHASEAAKAAATTPDPPPPPPTAG